MRVEFRDRRRRALNLRMAEVGGAVDHLPLQVRQRHDVIVDHPERADARRRKIQQYRRAEPAGADDQHPRALERSLARPAHLAQHDVARVAFEFLRGKRLVHGIHIGITQRAGTGVKCENADFRCVEGALD